MASLGSMRTTIDLIQPTVVRDKAGADRGAARIERVGEPGSVLKGRRPLPHQIFSRTVRDH